MYGRQGDPIYTQAYWSGIGERIAQALGFAGAPRQSQGPSPFRPAPQPQAQPLPPSRPVPLIPQALQQAPLPALKACRNPRTVADERRAFAALEATASARRASAGRPQCDRLASRGLDPGQLALAGASRQFSRTCQCGFDPGQPARSADLGFQRASDRR